MILITNKAEIKKLHKKLISQLSIFTTRKIDALTGHKGNSITTEVCYSKELNIWWDMSLDGLVEGKSGKRYWNAFGIDEPIPNKLSNIVCEINYPEEGINKRVAANWVKEGNDYLLVHSGKIGGGRIGIGKNGFIQNYNGVFLEVDNSDLPNEITVIGNLNDPNLAFQIKSFVEEVARIKQLLVRRVPSSRKHTPLEIIEHSFNEEFVGTKEYLGKKEKISSTANHGLVVNSLKNLISIKDKLVANDKQRDLYLYTDKGLIRTVFEIKTSLTSQTIFTAVGQLFVNNIRLMPVPRLIYVIPEKPNINLAKTLKKLGIEVLVYYWKNNLPEFKDLEKVI